MPSLSFIPISYYLVVESTFVLESTSKDTLCSQLYLSHSIRWPLEGNYVGVGVGMHAKRRKVKYVYTHGQLN
jgi:hypothetical protein